MNYLLSPYENEGFLKKDELRLYEILEDRNKSYLKKLYDFINIRLKDIFCISSLIRTMIETCMD